MRVLAWLGLWVLCAILLAVTAGRQCLNYYRLSKNGLAVPGIARETLPHMQIGYSFELGGRNYRGVGQTSFVAAASQSIRIGDNVPVYYLRDNPTVNCLGDPKVLYANEVTPVIAVSLLFPTMLVGVLAYRRGSTKSEGARA